MANVRHGWLLLVVAGAWLAGCGSRSDLSLPGAAAASTPVVDASRDAVVDAPPREAAVDASPPAAAFATMTRTCGPADGPATQFVFSTSPLDCPPVAEPGTSADSVTVYRGVTGPATFAFSPSGPSGAGEAQWCDAAGCASPAHVTLDVTCYSVGATTATGTYRLDLVDGATVTGAFVATVCPGLALCG